MLTVNGDLVAEFSAFAGTSTAAFIPLLAAVIGIFVAFAILDRMQFSISRSVKK